MTNQPTIEIENNNQIFVSIAALNENYLLDTINDALEKAARPDLISFGIFNQKFPGEEFEDFSQFKNVRVINAMYDEALGVGLARANSLMLHAGEQFLCQIDAHNFFIPNWDKALIDDYYELHVAFPRVILAQSIVHHDKTAYCSDRYRKNLKSVPVFPLTISKEDGTATGDRSRQDEKKLFGKFLEHYTICAGAEFFTSANFIYEVPHDNTVIHTPEQELTALRACTRGYRIFSRGESTMSTLSRLKKLHGYVDNNGQEQQHELDLEEYDKCVYVSLLQENVRPGCVTTRRGIDHFSYLCGLNFGHFGAPDKESYDEYIKKSGYTFPRKTRERRPPQ
jgi:hypothetical protein